MNIKDVHYLEVSVAQIIDRETEEGDLAWDELTDHHANQFVKEGRYLLEEYWLGYRNDPYENLEVSKEDYGNGWTNEGMLGKVVADYILKERPDFDQWEKVLLYVTW